MTRVGLSKVVVSLVCLAGLPALAQRQQDVPTAVVAGAAAKPHPWGGSLVIYGHSFSANSLNKAAEPRYNPFYGHRLELLPMWHLHPLVFLRGRLELNQELTVSDDTTYRHELVASDVRLDVGTMGWTEPRTKIALNGTLRFTFPLSKISQAQTMRLSVGPGIAVSRRFNVLSGLFFRYDARFTQRFHRYTTTQYLGTTLPDCADLRSFDCADQSHSGQRNIVRDVAHGVTSSIMVLPKLEVGTSFFFSHRWLYGLSGLTAQRAPELATAQNLGFASDVGVRHLTAFQLGVTWYAWRGLSVATGASTLTPQPGVNGLRQTPFFNRLTTLYVDVGFDIDGFLSTN